MHGEDAYWRRAFAAQEPRLRVGVDAHWRQALEDIWGMLPEEQAADLAAVPGGYGLSSTASLWRALSQSQEEDAAEP